MNNGLLCAGAIYLECIGSDSGLIGPLNTTKLEIKPTSENKPRLSTQSDSYGQALDSVDIPGPTEISISLDDQPAEILEMALQGSSEVINQEAGSLTEQAVMVLKGGWTELPLSNIVSTGLVVTNTDDSDAPLALGVDFEINYQMGMIKPLPDGAIVDGANVKITATSNAYTGTRVNGGSELGKKYRLLLSGKNLANQNPIQLTVGKCSLSPTNGTDFMAGDFVSTELSGKIEITAQGIAPYSYEERNV